MSRLTDPASTEAYPASRNVKAQWCAEQKCDTDPVVTAEDPFLARWLHTIADDRRRPKPPVRNARHGERDGPFRWRRPRSFLPSGSRSM